MVTVTLNANPTLIFNDFHQHACLFNIRIFCDDLIEIK